MFNQPRDDVLLIRRVEASQERYVSQRSLAHAYARVGDEAEALASLERALQLEEPLVWLHLEPDFDPLRDEPRFQAIVDQIGLAEFADQQ